MKKLLKGLWNNIFLISAFIALIGSLVFKDFTHSSYYLLYALVLLALQGIDSLIRKFDEFTTIYLDHEILTTKILSLMSDK